MRMSFIGRRVARNAIALVGLSCAGAAGFAHAQAPEGPIPPKPGVEVQQAPPEERARLKVRVALVNTPVTVRDASGKMVHDLDAKNFLVTDNGVAQQISNFDLGGD